MKRILVSGLVATIGFGCGSSGGADSDPADLIASELEKQTDARCECADEPGSLSSFDPDTCEDGFDTEDYSRCTTRALEDEKKEDRDAFLACVLKIEQTFTSCSAKTATSICGLSEDCGEAYDTVYEDKCSKLVSKSAVRAFGDCTP